MQRSEILQREKGANLTRGRQGSCELPKAQPHPTLTPPTPNSFHPALRCVSVDCLLLLSLSSPLFPCLACSDIPWNPCLACSDISWNFRRDGGEKRLCLRQPRKCQLVQRSTLRSGQYEQETLRPLGRTDLPIAPHMTTCRQPHLERCWNKRVTPALMFLCTQACPLTARRLPAAGVSYLQVRTCIKCSSSGADPEQRRRAPNSVSVRDPRNGWVGFPPPLPKKIDTHTQALLDLTSGIKCLLFAANKGAGQNRPSRSSRNRITSRSKNGGRNGGPVLKKTCRHDAEDGPSHPKGQKEQRASLCERSCLYNDIFNLRWTTSSLVGDIRKSKVTGESHVSTTNTVMHPDEDSRISCFGLAMTEKNLPRC